MVTNGMRKPSRRKALGLLDEAGRTVETLVGDLVERTPAVVAGIESMLPAGFPEQVAAPVLRGLEREARRLGEG